MPNRPINVVLATNLQHFMAQSSLKTQAALASKAGVSQRTIGNYLKPKLRLDGSKGKAPSAKLAELEMIADALGVDVWQLLRPMTAADRVIYQKIEEAVEEVRAIAASNKPLSPAGAVQRVHEKTSAH